MFNDTHWSVAHKRRRCGKSSDSEADDDVAAARPTKKPSLADSSGSVKVFSNRNHIYFHCGMSKQSVYKLQEQMLKIQDNFDALQQKNPHVKIEPMPIYLHINSYGGGVFAAFAAIDMIKQSRLPVYTIVEGATASAGTLMSVVGKKRFIRPHASMLIHQLSSWFGGKMSEIEDEYKNLFQMMDTIRDIYKRHTRIEGTDLDNMLKKDLWWKADRCLELGLVDALWEPLKK